MVSINATFFSRQTLAVIMQDQTDNYIGLDKNTTNAILKTQDKPDTCWAAGIQMLLTYEGLLMTQEQIVLRVLDINSINDDCDKHLSGQEIGDLMRDLKMKVSDKIITLKVTEYSDPVRTDDILRELEKNKPVMLSYNKSNVNLVGTDYGHVVVITGANYNSSNDIKTIRQLNVLDPENNIDSVRQTYENDELQNILSSMNVLWTIEVA